MSREDFPQSRILNAQMLSDLMRESNRNGARFCFILGAGASVESGIPSGGELEMRWMNCIMGKSEDDGTPPMDPGRMREYAQRLKDDKYNEHSFDQMVEAWNTAKENGWRTLPSELYFDLYNLRFFPDYDNGYHYLERLMEHCTPSIGYRVLTLLLTEEGDRNNLVITTNFDALVEDALFLYGEKRPLSVNHEALASFFSSNIQRPIIVRIHRGMFLQPFNTPQQTDHLAPEWNKVLGSVMENYTPIVIGYGGGDGSLMTYLEQISPRKQFYWCYCSGSGDNWVEERVEKLLLEKRKGFLVEIAGFDALMLALGSRCFADCITPTETVRFLQERCKGWTDNYQKKYNKLDPEAKKAAAPVAQAEERREVEREKRNQLSTWDYVRRGDRAAEEGYIQKAIDDYSEAIRLKPDNEARFAIEGPRDNGDNDARLDASVFLHAEKGKTVFGRSQWTEQTFSGKLPNINLIPVTTMEIDQTQNMGDNIVVKNDDESGKDEIINDGTDTAANQERNAGYHISIDGEIREAYLRWLNNRNLGEEGK